jgi:DNA-directed RNA polymerase subunit K/omega
VFADEEDVMDQDFLEALTEKIGGRYRLTALIQKRLQSLIRMRKLGTTSITEPLLDTVMQEIATDKIKLVPLTESEAMPLLEHRRTEEEEKEEK